MILPFPFCFCFCRHIYLLGLCSLSLSLSLWVIIWVTGGNIFFVPFCFLFSLLLYKSPKEPFRFERWKPYIFILFFVFYYTFPSLSLPACHIKVTLALLSCLPLSPSLPFSFFPIRRSGVLGKFNLFFFSFSLLSYAFSEIIYGLENVFFFFVMHLFDFLHVMK